MHRTWYSTATVVAITLATCMITLPTQAANCTAAKVAGNWSFTTDGVLLTAQGAVPLASVGGFVVDSSGNFSGKQTRNIAGQIAEETINGTGTINPDCSGSLTVNVLEAGILVRTTTLSAQWDDNMNEENALFTSIVLKPSEANVASIVKLHARRQVPRE